MIRVLFVFALIGASYASWDTPSFNVRFGIGDGNFIEMPLNTTNATSRGWVNTTRPTSPEGLESLVMYCPANDYTLCILYDDTDYIAGVQVSINKEYIEAYIYDWDVQGFIEWNVTFANGTVSSYWTKQMFFYSAETLATSSSSRLASRNSSTVLQDTGVWVTGFNGKLFKISLNVSEITGSDSVFKENACFPLMGHHYYYNMTPSLECKADTLFNWFPLTYAERLVAVGMTLFAKYSPPSNMTQMEGPPKMIVKLLANKGPDCLFDLVDSPGFYTMHMYFVRPALRMICINDILLNI